MIASISICYDSPGRRAGSKYFPTSMDQSCSAVTRVLVAGSVTGTRLRPFSCFDQPRWKVSMWSRRFCAAAFLIGKAVAQAQNAFFQTPISAFFYHWNNNKTTTNVFNQTTDSQAYDQGLFSPVEDLSILSETEFTTLSHPAFPRYGVRMKKSSFCDPTVQ